MQVKPTRQPEQELLDDICSRFILNVPADDLESFERLLFTVEQAHWFYEDSVRVDHPELRSFSLRDFTVLVFQSCPCLAKYRSRVHQIYDAFNAYKVKVPVAGAIILDSSLQRCLLVKGWKASASWGFPKGKKSKDEEDATCAAREVLEEIDFDISPLLDKTQYLETGSGGRRCRLFIVAGVDTRTPMQPQTKKEISEIGWHSLADLVNAKADGAPPPGGGPPLASKAPSGAKLYLVQPFVRQIAVWVASHHTPATRALAVRSPVEPGVILTCYKAKLDDSPLRLPPDFIAHTASSAQQRSPAAAAALPVTAAAPSSPLALSSLQGGQRQAAWGGGGSSTAGSSLLSSLRGAGGSLGNAPLPKGVLPLNPLLPQSERIQTSQSVTRPSPASIPDISVESSSAAQFLNAPEAAVDALGRPLFLSLRNFAFDMKHIEDALSSIA